MREIIFELQANNSIQHYSFSLSLLKRFKKTKEKKTKKYIKMLKKCIL